MRPFDSGLLSFFLKIKRTNETDVRQNAATDKVEPNVTVRSVCIWQAVRVTGQCIVLSKVLYLTFVDHNVRHNIIHIKKYNTMQHCIKILFHIYMKLNMFRATHRSSSGGA
jgi:hypothetical protein